MNVFICTAFILTQPKLKKVKHQNYCYMLLSLHNVYNSENRILNLKIKAFAKAKIAKRIFDLYKQKDKVLIEGSIDIKKILLLSNHAKKYSAYIRIDQINNIYI
uniref:Single-stranded DNA binding protein n=1 Tax=Hydropuntia rangiferina TaxID=338881 RepID=A0A345U8C3_9FLOR|nr:hypothetical protein [Hydropuntia rangiferina]AXI96709.1 hypothetical protein [Hydropuntia rangiferina]UAD87392.1 hypothetical protein [Hydropuntia rangiferina]